MPGMLNRANWFQIAMLAMMASAGRTNAATPPHIVDSSAASQEAREFEQSAQWDKAIEIYVRLLAQDRDQPNLRDRLQFCIRRGHQARRQRDPVYRDKLLSLPVSQALALYVEVLTKLNAQYADRDKVPIDRLYQHGLEELRAALADPMFVREHLSDAADSVANGPATADLLDRIRDEYAVRTVLGIKDARAAVRDLAWDAQRLTGLNPTATILELACGASNALDEYTVFLTPGQSLDNPAARGGELAAYGILLNWKDRRLVIDRIVPGSWAAGLGLRAGDTVTSVGKQPLGQLLPDAVAELLRGDAVAIAELTVLSAGESTLRVVELPAFVPSVQDDRIEREGIGYLRVSNFQKSTLRELDSALLRLRSEGMRVLILDLRGNPGGLFAAAVQVADRFLAAGVIVSTQGQLRAYSKTYQAEHPLAAVDVPLVVLIDGDTASAAEVVAGALKENERALLVGQTTFGKGTIQKLVTLQAGGGLYLTLARFFAPHGQPFAGVGVTPHIVESRRDEMKDFQFDLALEQAVRLLTMR